MPSLLLLMMIVIIIIMADGDMMIITEADRVNYAAPSPPASLLDIIIEASEQERSRLHQL